VTVGEALDEVVIQKFESRGINVAVGFGQAETPLIVGRVDDQPHLPNTMGKPIDPPYRVAILDDDFNHVNVGEIGQIALDMQEGGAGGIMRGYANAPERTKKAFSPCNRYYLTGDWAKFSLQGMSYAGRRDDLIKSHGYRIGPDEIEKVGMTHPAVAKIAVVGVRTDANSLDISVKAFILLKPDIAETSALKNEIQEHIKAQASSYKYPRVIEFLSLEEWEKYETTSGKIRRRGLREREEMNLSHSTTNGVRGISP
jgi:acetyl-CoA synthetase